MILDNWINLHRFEWRNCQQFTDYLLALGRVSVLKVFFNLIIVFCDSEYSKFLNSFLTFFLNYNNNRAKENTVL